MKKTTDLSNKTKTELTAMARRKKIPVTSGMLKDELIKAIKKGLRKIEAQKKSKAAKQTSKKKSPKTSKAKTARKPKSIPRKKSPAKAKAKKAPAKKPAARKTPTARPPKTVKSQATPKPVETQSDLPDRYGDHRLVVLARDANWAYAYWDLDPARVRDLLKSSDQTDDQARWILRVYSAALQPVEVKGNYFDIDIDVKTGSYYLDLSRPGARFIVEIGVMDAAGMFRATAQSNPIILPMNHPSETTAPEGTAPPKVSGSSSGSGFTNPPSSRSK
jgi:hypothetical protein